MVGNELMIICPGCVGITENYNCAGCKGSGTIPNRMYGWHRNNQLCVLLSKGKIVVTMKRKYSWWYGWLKSILNANN